MIQGAILPSSDPDPRGAGGSTHSWLIRCDACGRQFSIGASSETEASAKFARFHLHAKDEGELRRKAGGK